MTTWLARIGLVWLAASVLTMLILSAMVYLGSRRQRDAGVPRVLTFEDKAPVVPLAKRAAASESAASAPPAEPAVTRRVTADSGALERMLAGVALPCGLERLPVEGEDDTRRMAFVTSGVDPRTVAVSVTDELGRLGMDVETLSYNEARVHRDGLEISVTIHLQPHQVIRDRRLAFPGVEAGSVVIEFSVD